MPEDSTGKNIFLGDRVHFRGEEYTIKSFGPMDGVCGTHQINFEEEQHVKEIADEMSVDLVQ